MKDYYKINQEIIICKTTIKHLEMKKERLFARATNTTSQLKQDITSGGNPENAIEVYVEKLIDKVEKELTEKQEELKELLLSRGKIEEALRKIAENKNNDLERIFIYKYIDGKSMKDISRLMPCDLSTVYRKIKQIKRII